MIHEKGRVRLTEKDEQRFTIYDTPREEIEGLIANVKKTFTLISTVIGIVLVGLIVAVILIPNMWVRLVLGVLAIIALYMLFSNYDLYRTNTRIFEGRSHYILVELLEKLPIENETWLRRGYTYYPARVKDKSKGHYMSTCFLSQTEYENSKIGDELKLFVSPTSQK